MDKQTLKRIEKAKQIAKKDYEDAMKRDDSFNPNLKRKWREIKDTKNNRIAYALNGTPDKAFVFYYPEIGKIFALRWDGSLIKEV